MSNYTKVIKDEKTHFPYLVEYDSQGNEVKRDPLMPAIGVWDKERKTHYCVPAEYDGNGNLTKSCLETMRVVSGVTPEDIKRSAFLKPLGKQMTS